MSHEVTTLINHRTEVLPSWTSVLAVVAHPDDESFALGAILAAFTGAGAEVQVLCLTHGEASTLHGVPGDLESVRGAELAAAAAALGVNHTTLEHHPDGALSEVSRTTLAAEVVAAAESCRADGLLVFDTSGVTGHQDHAAATSVGLLAAGTLNLPVLGWTLPKDVAAQLNQEVGASFTGHRDEDIDLRVAVASQALPNSVLWRRLELLGDTESLRWLRRSPMRVEHRGEDRFDINVRGHVLRVDQPRTDGGQDTAPTPTELFVASLASCVASHCTVHNTLTTQPQVWITLA